MTSGEQIRQHSCTLGCTWVSLLSPQPRAGCLPMDGQHCPAQGFCPCPHLLQPHTPLKLHVCGPVTPVAPALFIAAGLLQRIPVLGAGDQQRCLIPRRVGRPGPHGRRASLVTQPLWGSTQHFIARRTTALPAAHAATTHPFPSAITPISSTRAGAGLHR